MWWDILLRRRRACFLPSLPRHLLPNNKAVEGLARFFYRFRCCRCRAMLWHHVLTGTRFQHVPHSTTRPAVGSTAFHYHKHTPGTSECCGCQKGFCGSLLLENKVPGSDARLTYHCRDTLYLSVLGEKAPIQSLVIFPGAPFTVTLVSRMRMYSIWRRTVLTVNMFPANCLASSL